MALNWEVYEGRVSGLKTAKSKIYFFKSTYKAVWFRCSVGGAVAESVFTTVQFKDGDPIRIVYSTNWLGDRHTIQAVLNLSNGILHMPPWQAGSSKWKFFVQTMQMAMLFTVAAFIFLNSIFVLPLLYGGQSLEKVHSVFALMLLLTLYFAPVALLASIYTFFTMLGSVIHSAEIFRLLRFPDYRHIYLSKLIVFKSGIPRFFYAPAMYREGRKVFYGIYDSRIMFKDQPDYLRDVVLQPDRKY